MRIAILEAGAPPAALQPRFGRYGDMMVEMLGPTFETERFDVRAGHYPNTDEADGYVITGSAAGVYDPDPWIGELKAWTAEASGTAPMIGICFGHQLMAEAFGGQVIKSPKGWGVGLHGYRLERHPLAPPTRTLKLPVSHQDQVAAVGEGGEVIGGSAFCPNGVIAYPARRALSLQPHPEFDPAFAEALIITRRDGPLEPAQADTAIASLQAPNDRPAAAVWLRRFLLEG